MHGNSPKPRINVRGKASSLHVHHPACVTYSAIDPAAAEQIVNEIDCKA